jgi:predicted nucleic acid-binding protein
MSASAGTFLDTGILVGAVLLTHPEHAACRQVFAKPSGLLTDAHCLAETFATLTGFYGVPNGEAAELTLGLCEVIRVEDVCRRDYETAIREAKARGVMGGGIYDSLHATVARRCKARRIVTRNPGHFAPVAPEVEILTPQP